MEPLFFNVKIVETYVPQQTQLKLLVFAVPTGIAGNSNYTIKFKLDPDSTPPGGDLTPLPKSSSDKISLEGTYQYYFEVGIGDPWSLGGHQIVAEISGGTDAISDSASFVVQPPLLSASNVVTLAPNVPYDTKDEPLWTAIKASRLEFEPMFEFVRGVLCAPSSYGAGNNLSNRLPFVQTAEYSVLKFAIEAYMMAMVNPTFQAKQLSSYLVPNPNMANQKIMPYYDLILEKLSEISFTEQELKSKACLQKLVGNAQTFSLFELIWSYWHEEAMLVQTMNAISQRFQNMGRKDNQNPLFRLDTANLLPLSDLIWGYVQDEQHTLSMHRRVYEYDHAYGLTLIGKAVPQVKAVDTRSRFLEGFHNLLHKCAIYFRESDDTTRIPDGFPVLNALREVHLLLAEGFHNSYANLTWTARHEMLVQQYLLAQPEMRQFLGGRAMVPYPEPWMDKVDTVRGMMGWGDSSVSNYWELATFGESILLSVRFGSWIEVIDPAQAANWAIAFRNEIMRYIHAYRTVTGVDLSADTVGLKAEHFAQPALLIRRRLGNAGRINSGAMRREMAYANN
jgi:hypothetical protein